MKKIWIWNHYATNMFVEKGGRHHWFAKILKNKGYEPTIFAASTNHVTSENITRIDEDYSLRYSESIPYVFIPTNSYKGNGIKRVINMLTFYFGLIKASNKIVKIDKPDYILASSVHPLTLVAGIKVAKKNKIPCICEVRDLWPESLVAYGIIKETSLIAKILYKGEKWIYKNSSKIIMTWEGGIEYIADRGWLNEIGNDKIVYISNGLLLNEFDNNARKYDYKDIHLDNDNYFKIVYTGSIRKVNNLDVIIDSAKKIQNEAPNVKFLIFGEGNEKETLEKRCQQEKVINVFFKGKVSKKYIPSILTKSDINLLHNKSTSLNKYGQSQNKLFEYLASGRPILQTYKTGYSVIEKFNCGICCSKQNSSEISKEILYSVDNQEKLLVMGKNARKTSVKFDFEKLTEKLVMELKKLDDVNRSNEIVV